MDTTATTRSHHHAATLPHRKSARRGLHQVALAALAFAILGFMPGQGLVQAADSDLSNETRQKHLNLNKSKLAIDGYDPVSYHKDGPVKGKKDKAVRYKGVIYRFASDANKDAFLKSPSKYEPAYGGWCAWAMQEGDKTDIDPKTYLVVDGRTYLFYNGWLGNTKKNWQKRVEKDGDAGPQIEQAGREWAKITG